MNINAESGGKVNGLLHVSESYTADELAEKIRTGVPSGGQGRSHRARSAIAHASVPGSHRGPGDA